MSIFWTYNLPLQLWPANEDNNDQTTLLVYMPRKESVIHLKLADVIGELTREEFMEQTALRLENLARLFRTAKEDKELTIYYPDEGMEEIKNMKCENCKLYKKALGLAVKSENEYQREMCVSQDNWSSVEDYLMLAGEEE